MRGTLRREGKTNQRLGFDLDPTGQWLVTGDTNGMVSVFGAEMDPDNSEPVSTFQAAQGSVGSVQFTPDGKRLLTCAGSRCFDRKLPLNDDDETDASDDDGEAAPPERSRQDSLQLWSLG
ncbi:hypothetical protein P7C70_g1540, partial [Phenoliferia sp. Uapishka_3]